MELLRPIVILAMFSWGCTGGAPPASNVREPAAGDSLLIDPPAVVFFRQDSLRMQRIKAVLKDQVFQTLSHDCYFEMKFVRSVLQRDRPALAVVNASDNRWLVFRKKDGVRIAIDLHSVNDLCGVFLFDGMKDPMRGNMPNIESQLWSYFGAARN